jgi:hypothetical protein
MKFSAIPPSHKDFYGILCQTDFSGNSFENFICIPHQKNNQFCLDGFEQLPVV